MGLSGYTFRFTHAVHIRTLNHNRTSLLNMSRTRSGDRATYMFDPLNALGMHTRSRSPAPGRDRADGGGASRRRSQSRASSRDMCQHTERHRNSRRPPRPTLPVRHERPDEHDTPAQEDPYMEPEAEDHSEEEESEEEGRVGNVLYEDGEINDAPPMQENPAPPWAPRAATRAGPPRRREPKPSSIVTLLTFSEKVRRELVVQMVEALGCTEESSKEDL